MFAGGRAPGGPRPLPRQGVAVWRGIAATGAPLLTFRADADGFFRLELPPGTYTLRLTGSGVGYPALASAKVVSGRVVAAGVYGEGM